MPTTHPSRPPDFLTADFAAFMAQTAAPMTNALSALVEASKGGPGSGNFRHAGRPGLVGGSAQGRIASAGLPLRKIFESVAWEDAYRAQLGAQYHLTPTQMAALPLNWNHNQMVREQAARLGIEDVHVSLSEPSARITADVIANLPPGIASNLSIEMHQKELNEGATAFGSSGSYDPPGAYGSQSRGRLQIALQGDNSPLRQAWAVAHEAAHAYSCLAYGQPSRAMQEPLLGLLGFSEDLSISNSAITNDLQLRLGGPREYANQPTAKRITRYSALHPEEAFAEAFAGYMIAPRQLLRTDRALYRYLKENFFASVEYEGYAERVSWE